MGTALARYIAVSKDHNCRYYYLLAGFFLAVTPAVIVLIAGLLFADKLTIIVFHSRNYLPLLVATLLLVVGHSFYTVLYALYRGLGKMSKANLWQLGVMALGPVIIALGYAKSGRVDLIILLMAAAFFTALIPLVFYIFSTNSRSVHLTKLKGHLGELIRYGLPRVPGGLAFVGILAMPPFLASYFGSLKDAGYLMVGQSLFRIVEGAVGPFGIVVLPKVARLFAGGENEFLKDRVTDIIALVFHIGLFATLHLFLWSDQIVLVWLGSEYAEAIPLLRIFLLALVPYLAFAMLRSIVDAVQERALNTLNLCASFVITLLTSLVLAKVTGVTGLAIGTAVGLTALGLFTAYYLKVIYKIHGQAIMIKQCVLANTALIAAALVLKYLLETAFTGVVLICLATLIELLFLFLYCFTLCKMNVRWMVELKHRTLNNI